MKEIIEKRGRQQVEWATDTGGKRHRDPRYIVPRYLTKVEDLQLPGTMALVMIQVDGLMNQKPMT